MSSVIHLQNDTVDTTKVERFSHEDESYSHRQFVLFARTRVRARADVRGWLLGECVT